MDNSTAPVDYPITANGVILPIMAILSIAISYVPLLSLIRVKNIAVITLVILSAWTNLLVFLNAVIWPNDNQATWFNGHGLCDIEVSLKNPVYTLLATSICCLMKDLAQAVDLDNPRLFESRAMRRRRITVDVLIIFAVPVMMTALHYIVQEQRYALVAVYGCIDWLDDSWLRLVLLSIWPVVFSVPTCYYAGRLPHVPRFHLC